MSRLELVHITSDADAEAFYQKHRDPRLATVKKPEGLPEVGDTVRLNDRGIEQCFGNARGLRHMKTLTMKVTHVGAESVTFPEPTFEVEVDNEEINSFLIDHTCFDVVGRAKDERREPCPECGTGLLSDSYSGVRCPKPGCGYWFCY